MLKIENFTKGYNGVPLYSNFNLTVADGQITCILGESGCGKTTLLNGIAGIIPYDGSITKVKCSYIFQTPRLVPNLTVRDNLRLVCKDNDKICDMLKKVHLFEKANSYPKTLSGGQAQRVAIARAFLYDGDVILLDEPFSSLDLKLKQEMSELFLNIWQDTKKISLYVTHDIDEALSISNRIIVIHQGKITFDKLLKSPVPRKNGECESERRELIFNLLKG
jgi:ABC-type nitrate/sulfonate/bicarbonate transport system ATPase subunit